MRRLYIVGLFLFLSDQVLASTWEKIKRYSGGSQKNYFYVSMGSISTEETDLEKDFIDYYNPQEKDEKSSTFKIVLGRKIGSYFSLEAQFVGLGTSKYRYDEAGLYGWTDWETIGSWGIPYIASYTFEDEIESSTNLFGINAVGRYPVLSYLTVFGKAGLDYSMTEVKHKWSAQEVHVSQSSWYPGTYYFSDGSTEKKDINNIIPYFSFGALINILDDLFIIAEYEKYLGLADGKFLDVSTKYDADIFSVGFGMNF